MKKFSVIACLLLAATACTSAEMVFYLNDTPDPMIIERTSDPDRILMKEDIDDARNWVYVRPPGSPADAPYVNQYSNSLEFRGEGAILKDSKGKVYYQGYRLDPQPDFSRSQTRHYRLDNGQGLALETDCPSICFMRARFDDGQVLYHGNYAAPPGFDEAYGVIPRFHVLLQGRRLRIERGTNLVAAGELLPPPDAIVPNAEPCPPMAVAPLPTQATPLTTAGWEDMARKLYRRHLLAEGYLKDGHRDPAWDEDAIALIDGFICFYVNPWQGMKDDRRRLALSQSILDRGCRDPYVRFVHAMNLQVTGSGAEAKRILDELIPTFADPARPHAFMLFLLQYRCAHAGERRLFMAAAQTAFARAATDGSFRPEELRRLIFYFTEHTYFVSHLFFHNDDTALLELVGRNPDLDPWFRETMLGYFHLHRAWREIWTQNFDPYDVRDWPAYAADLDAARQHLENAIAIDPNYPEPYRFLIRLARLAPHCNQEEARRWFDRAIACQFDYMPAYEELIEAFRPSSGGSIQLLFDLGLACAQTRRYDTQVPDYIYRTLEEIGADTGNLHDILDAPGAAEALLDTAMAYVDQNVFRTRNLTRAAAVCWFFGDYAGAGQFLSRIPPKTPINRRTLETFRTSEKEIAADVYLHTGLATGRLDDRMAADQVVRNRQFLAELEKRLATGDWTPLMKTDSLDGWHVRYGAMTLTTNREAETRNTNRRFQLRGQMDLGEAYEIAVDFELAIPTNYSTWGAGLGTYNSPPPFGGAGLCQAEVVTAYYPGIRNVYVPETLDLSGRDLGLPSGGGATVFRGPDKIFPRLGRNTLLLRANGSRAEIYLNTERIRDLEYRAIPGQKVFPYLYAPDTYSRFSSATVRYGNLRARRLAPGTRLDELPRPETIPSPIWVASAPPEAEKPSAAERAAATPEPTASARENAAQALPVLTVQELPAGTEPVWVTILPPDTSSTNWRVAWEAPDAADAGPNGAAISPTYTLLHTTNLMQPFTPIQTGIASNEIPIPLDAPAGFFHVVPEPAPAIPAD